ncbi:MAG TPA: hypothetical protein VM848_04605 [Acidimicrobiia bacterium]|nr:hypothetical protein [Acidimicrobiia bacterium]
MRAVDSTPEIWIIAPDQGRRLASEILASIRVHCDEKGWSHRLVGIATLKNSAGKPVALLDPETGDNLYRRMHKVRLGVLDAVGTSIQLNPTRNVLDKRFLAKLSRLVRYKGFYSRIPGPGIASILNSFTEWAESQHCSDDRDPRVLPLHSFCPGTNIVNLDTVEGQTQFRSQFGPPNSLTCEQDMRWIPDRARHGRRESQNVAGFTLTPGFQWDVEADRHHGKILTLCDVWEIPRSRHLNIYPNGHVRAQTGTRLVATVRR